jgi:flagellar basal-body rod protein FlgC
MDFQTAFKVSGSGMAAQRARLDVAAANLANAGTTRTPEGGPYRKRAVVLAAEGVEGRFNSVVDEALRAVKIEGIVEVEGAVKQVYDPAHPDAAADGYVAMSDINVLKEMADLITASRSYEACVTAFDATKNMTLKTLEMGR